MAELTGVIIQVAGIMEGKGQESRDAFKQRGVGQKVKLPSRRAEICPGVWVKVMVCCQKFNRVLGVGHML